MQLPDHLLLHHRHHHSTHLDAMASWKLSTGNGTRSPWLDKNTAAAAAGVTVVSSSCEPFDGEVFEEFLISLEDLRDNRKQEARMLEVMVNSVRSRLDKMKQADELRGRLESTLKQREIDLRESLERKQNEIDKLRQRCDEGQATIDDLKEQNAHLQEEIKCHRSKVSERDYEANNLRSEVRHLQNEVTRLQENIQSMNNERKLQLNQLPILQRRISELEGEKENAISVSKECQERASRVQIDLTQANDTIATLREELTKAKSKISVLSEVSSKQDHLVTDKECKLQHLESDLKVCLARLQRKEIEQQEQSKDFERLKSKYKELQEKLAISDQLILSMKKQLVVGSSSTSNQTHLPVMSQSKYQRNPLFTVSSKSAAAAAAAAASSSSSTTTTSASGGGRAGNNCVLEGFKCSKGVK